MNRQKNNKKPWVRIVLYAYMLMILLSLVTVASYTWFSLSRTPRVSDMDMYVNSQSRMELALDPHADEWKVQLDIRDLISDNAPLRPVTWVDEEQRFYAAAYGMDGRLLPFDRWEPLTDESNANKDTFDSYYIKLTIYARSSTPVDVTLSPAVAVDDGVNGAGTYLIGTPVWNSQEILHNDGGLGAQNAIRMGIRITKVDTDGQPTGEEPLFYIYEPNCDTHLNEPHEYIPTPSITGREGLIDEAFLIRQTATTWTEAYPVERDVVIKDMGTFLDKPKLFSLATGEIAKLEIYIWLEGQDVDCTNKIQEAQILANLQFAADPSGQSGLKPIE